MSKCTHLAKEVGWGLKARRIERSQDRCLAACLARAAGLQEQYLCCWGGRDANTGNGQPPLGPAWVLVLSSR